MKFEAKPNKYITPCPECNNNTSFEAFSQQVCEDCCDVWIQCVCGYDPTKENPFSRYEDVWGGTSRENILIAIECWNDAIAEQTKMQIYESVMI